MCTYIVILRVKKVQELYRLFALFRLFVLFRFRVGGVFTEGRGTRKYNFCIMRANSSYYAIVKRG